MIDKGKLVAILLNYIEYSLRDWAENKDYLKEQEFDLSAYLTAPHSFLYKPARTAL